MIEYRPIEEILALPVHPIADLFPILEMDVRNEQEAVSMRSLSEDIKEKGIYHPIVIWWKDGDTLPYLIDGRNRLRAAKKARLTEVPVIYKDFASEEEVENFILSTNIKRRSMNKTQWAMVAAEYDDLRDKRRGTRKSSNDCGNTSKKLLDAELADKLNVSERYITEGRKNLIELASLEPDSSEYKEKQQEILEYKAGIRSFSFRKESREEELETAEWKKVISLLTTILGDYNKSSHHTEYAYQVQELLDDITEEDL